MVGIVGGILGVLPYKASREVDVRLVAPRAYEYLPGEGGLPPDGRHHQRLATRHESRVGLAIPER
jgi:hypothetical protein